jgi:hypothetical protein
LIVRVQHSRAAFDKGGFISPLFFNTKQPRGHKNKAALSTKKPRSVPGLIVRVQQSRTAFDKGGFISPLFSNAKEPRGQKNKAALSTTKPRSVPGWLDCTRATQPYGFRQRRLYFTAFIPHKTTGKSKTNKAALSTKKPRSVPG